MRQFTSSDFAAWGTQECRDTFAGYPPVKVTLHFLPRLLGWRAWLPGGSAAAGPSLTLTQCALLPGPARRSYLFLPYLPAPGARRLPCGV